MNILYIVDLTDAERDQLLELTSGGTISAHRIKRANILLMSDRGHTAETITEAGHGSAATI